VFASFLHLFRLFIVNLPTKLGCRIHIDIEILQQQVAEFPSILLIFSRKRRDYCTECFSESLHFGSDFLGEIVSLVDCGLSVCEEYWDECFANFSLCVGFHVPVLVFKQVDRIIESRNLHQTLNSCVQKADIPTFIIEFGYFDRIFIAVGNLTSCAFAGF